MGDFKPTLRYRVLVAGASMVLVSINPATGETLKKFKEWKPDRIRKKIRKSSHAFDQWKSTDFSERKRLLLRTAHLLRKKNRHYAQLITIEIGKPITQSETEIEKCAWVCEYYAENGKRFLENENITTDADVSYVRFSPLGPLLAVMPWNFPFWQVFRCTVPAVMAGNVILLKHASNVPQCALALEELFTEAGFPTNVFQSLLIGSRQVEAIIRDEHVAAVTLTGSTSAGRHVAMMAGAHLKKVVLELGGNDPFVILADANLEYATEQAVKARMINTGQSCIAAKRFVIVKDVFDEFARNFSEKTQQLIVGDPLQRSTDIGPLAKKEILNRLERQVKKSIQKGATVITGGHPMKNNLSNYYTPTVLQDVTRDMPVYQQETFGPVASLIKVRDEDNAIRVANDTTYGLGASIWTSNVRRGESLAQEFQSGAVFINEIVKSDPRLPFGGIKNSGYGRELSHYGIKEFVNIQTVYMKKHL